MFLESEAVLQISYTVTSFFTAIYPDSFFQIYGQTVDGIWLANVMKWHAI